MSRRLVTVDGIDGSGKSTFGARLAAALGRAGVEALLVRVDDYRAALDWSTGDEAGLYYERYYAFEDLAATLDAFAAGTGRLTIPGFDGLAGRPGAPRTLAAGPQAVLVLEGVFVERVRFPTLPRTAVFLDLAPELARARLLARDIARGRSREEVERRLDQRYVPGQARYHRECAPRDRAQVLVDNTDPTSPVVLRAALEGATAGLRQALSEVLGTRY